MKNPLICVFDTTVCDNNLGNAIIMEPIWHWLEEEFPDAFLIKLPYLETIGEISVRYHQQSMFTFFGGTNALSPMLDDPGRLWGVDESNRHSIRGVVLVGVGWKHYSEPNQYTREVYGEVLNKRIMHAVRDSYSEQQLRGLGFENVINTGCPSLWQITGEHCRKIPKVKSENVLLTLTCYNTDESDRELVDILKRSYQRIYFWPQGSEDLEYLSSFAADINILPPRLSGLDDFLRSDISCDYIGTRLHAGIRALQFGRRSLILAVDGRVVEMSKGTNLPLLSRQSLEQLEEKIHSSWLTEVVVPHENIAVWKSQFRS